MHRDRQDKHVADEFDRQASHYDDSLTVGSFQRRAQALVVNEMQIAKGMHILDLGCGTGTATIEIASKLDGTGKVVGLDLSERMIEQAERKLAVLGCTNVTFVVGNGTELGYDGCFDYVLSTNAFHHFGDKEEVFSQVWRSLKPGGIFWVQDICDDFVLMRAVDLLGKIGERAHVGSTTALGLRELLASVGFVDVEVQVQKLNWFWGIMVGKGVRDHKPGGQE
ncbi:MAG: methyltransferase domain-containing protein [Anaerolineae bacterium]|nr:methyltransferase domain-containing protein [Anaerolineae bacterium]